MSGLCHVPRTQEAALPVKVRTCPLTVSNLQHRWVPVPHAGMRVLSTPSSDAMLPPGARVIT